MKALLILALASSMFTPAMAASHFNQCDTVLEIGEKPNATIFGLGLAIASAHFADKHCGAKLPNLKANMLEKLQAEGCGPDTDIAKEVAAGIEKMADKDLHFLFTNGNPDKKLNSEDLTAKAAQFEISSGGCEKLVSENEALFGETQ